MGVLMTEASLYQEELKKFDNLNSELLRNTHNLFGKRVSNKNEIIRSAIMEDVPKIANLALQIHPERPERRAYINEVKDFASFYEDIKRPVDVLGQAQTASLIALFSIPFYDLAYSHILRRRLSPTKIQHEQARLAKRITETLSDYEGFRAERLKSEAIRIRKLQTGKVEFALPTILPEPKSIKGPGKRTSFWNAEMTFYLAELVDPVLLLLGRTEEEIERLKHDFRLLPLENGPKQIVTGNMKPRKLDDIIDGHYRFWRIARMNVWNMRRVTERIFTESNAYNLHASTILFFIWDGAYGGMLKGGVGLSSLYNLDSINAKLTIPNVTLSTLGYEVSRISPYLPELEGLEYEMMIENLGKSIANDFLQKPITLVAIRTGGIRFAKDIQSHLIKTYGMKVAYCEVEIDKENEKIDEEIINKIIEPTKGRNVILVDDAVWTAKTYRIAIKELMRYRDKGTLRFIGDVKYAVAFDVPGLADYSVFKLNKN